MSIGSFAGMPGRGGKNSPIRKSYMALDLAQFRAYGARAEFPETIPGAQLILLRIRCLEGPREPGGL